MSEVTVAVFVSVPEAEPETATTMVIVAVFPGPGEGERSGTVHVTVAVPVQTTPADPVADTNVVFAGNVSDTFMPVAVVPFALVLKLVTVML